MKHCTDKYNPILLQEVATIIKNSGYYNSLNENQFDELMYDMVKITERFCILQQQEDAELADVTGGSWDSVMNACCSVYIEIDKKSIINNENICKI